MMGDKYYKSGNRFYLLRNHRIYTLHDNLFRIRFLDTSAETFVRNWELVECTPLEIVLHGLEDIEKEKVWR